MLLFVLLLFYFLSTPCAWYSCLKMNCFFIEFILSESGTIVRKFPLVEPYSHWDYIFFLLWMPLWKKRKINLSPFSLLPTPSLFVFLPQGFGCCAVSQSKACLSFYLTWEPLCPPQLYFEGRILFCWLLCCERAGGNELRWLGTASVESSQSLYPFSVVGWCGALLGLLPIHLCELCHCLHYSYTELWKLRSLRNAKLYHSCCC